MNNLDHKKAASLVDYYKYFCHFNKKQILRILTNTSNHILNVVGESQEVKLIMKLILINVDPNEIKDMTYQECLTWIYLFGEE